MEAREGKLEQFGMRVVLHACGPWVVTCVCSQSVLSCCMCNSYYGLLDKKANTYIRLFGFGWRGLLFMLYPFFSILPIHNYTKYSID